MAKRKTEFADIRSLRDLQKRTRSPAWALRLLEWLRWPDGRFCPHCGVMDHLSIPGRQAGLYECRGCRGQFSATSGTPLHGTKLPIGVWLEAAFLIASSSKGVSSVVLSKQLGVSQRTAWKIGHAVRLMMRPPDDEPKLSGVVEIDDMTDGGDPARANRAKYGATTAAQIHNPRGRGSAKKRLLVAVERGGRVRAVAMPDFSRETVEPLVQSMVAPEASLMTDGDTTLGAIGKAFASHQSVIHKNKEFARGEVHTNTAEGFHLYVQRAKLGVWHRWSETHQQRYVEELQFHWDSGPRFERSKRSRHCISNSTPTILAMRQIFSRAGGRRLRYIERGSVGEPDGSNEAGSG